ncbi:hypothetical protein J7M02_02660 [Candidatus Aerophobetes bacterium]|nr:hypothetical protein [Candidatus Aerophobetes bacterium]
MRRVKKWFKPKGHIGWSKDMSAKERRRIALKAKRGNYLKTARALLALANVTKDKETEKKARADAMYFFKMHKKRKKRKRGK